MTYEHQSRQHDIVYRIMHYIVLYPSFRTLNLVKKWQKFFLTTFTPPFRCYYIPSEMVDVGLCIHGFSHLSYHCVRLVFYRAIMMSLVNNSYCGNNDDG